MFNLSEAVSPLYRMLATRDGVYAALYRNGFTNGHKAIDLFYFLSDMARSKYMYAKPTATGISFHMHHDYSLRTFNERVKKLKGELLFLNTPYCLITEELKAGDGFDLTLFIKKSTKIKLISTPEDGDLISGRSENTTTEQVFEDEPYLSELFLEEYSIVRHDLDRIYGGTLSSLCRDCVEMKINDDKFLTTELKKYIFDFENREDSQTSFQVHRSLDKVVTVKAFSKVAEVDTDS